VGHNRKEASRALKSREGEIADRRYKVIQDIRFDEWGKAWLESFSGKETSRRVYAVTVEYATTVFGQTKIRDLDVADIRRFMNHIAQEHQKRRASSREEAIREAAVAPATVAKHLRQLGACLQAAVTEGYASENVVRRLHKSARPKVGKSAPAYYTDAELARLWPELEGRPVYAALCKLAATTGLRFGELAALRWSDVDLLNGELHVTKSWDGTDVTQPKSNESRTIDLTPQARTLIENWFAQGADDQEGLVFEKETGGHLDGGYVLKRVLYPALERAGVPRVGERGRKRDFHSLRHSFARIVLENGAGIDWVRAQLGHSSITLTVDTYGAWSRTSQKAQAVALEGVFAL